MKRKLIFNKKTLALEAGYSVAILNAHLKAMLSDRSVKKRFGKYRGRCFTPKQLRIIEEELGIEV